MDLGSIFNEVAALLVLAAVVGLIGQALRQPLVVSLLGVGILAGPVGLGIAEPDAHIELLAELGVAVLLFLVGLKLDLHLVRTVGGVALVTGLGQVAFTSLIGFGLCLALGLSPLVSVYVAVALTFSSTIIIVKLLSDKHELDSLHGRIALGFLIVQDLVVVLAMVVLSAFGVGQAARDPLTDALAVLLNGALFVAGTMIFVRYVAERLLKQLAHSPELLVSFGIGWAAFMAALGDELGFGKELGGLLAGISLASTSFREGIAARLTSLRDFLLLFFFIALGARLELSTLGDNLLPAVVLSIFVLVGNPLIVMVIMGLMGYRKRTGFLAGLTVAQISEFSLVFMAMGLSLGHVDEDALALVTLVGLVTIASSTYMIVYSQRLYARLEPLLSPFERRVPHRELGGGPPPDCRYDVILFGLGRYGTAIWHRLRAQGLRILGVDFDPNVIRRWRRLDRAAIYGDAQDPDFPSALPLRTARWVVCTTPVHQRPLTQQDPRLTLIHALRAQGYAGRIAVTATSHDQLAEFERRGADLVLLPFEDAADQATDLLLERQQRARECQDCHGSRPAKEKNDASPADGD